MGNCALKPKVLSEAGAPAPEEFKDSLLEDQKMDAAKSLSNLFLQDKADKKGKEDENTTPEKMPVTEDLKTTFADATTEEKSPAKAPAEYQKVRNEEAIRGEKLIDDATVKETETEAKPENKQQLNERSLKLKS